MRIINFRAFLIVFCTAVAGILSAFITHLAMPVGIALIVVLLTIILLFIVKSCIRREFYKLAAYLIAFVVTLYVVIAFFITQETRYQLSNEQYYTISGRVTEHTHYDEDSNVFYATIDNINADGKETVGSLRLTVYTPDELFREVKCGYTIAFEAEIELNELIKDNNISANSIRNDQRYIAECTGNEIIGVSTGKPKPLEYMRLTLRLHLIENMGEDNGKVAFGMIAGDKYQLDGDITEAYSVAGIGHILAVSGLHIGLISAVLCMLLFRLPIPRNLSRVLLTMLLLAYVIFTGGSPSAIRAFVMCIVGIWAAAFGKRDMLNCLCLAATVCLCISPFYLFECGYLMSVAAMLGLVLFTKPINAVLTRLHLPKKISYAISASLSVQLTVSPVMAYFFHRFYFWSFFVNALGLALLSAFFSIFAVCLPLALIPAMGFILVPFGFVIGALTQVCFFVSTLPLASAVWQVSAVIFLSVPLAFGLSRFVMLPNKRAANVIMLGLCVIVAVTAENSIKADNALVAVGGNHVATVIYNGKERYILGNFLYDITSALDSARVGGGEFVVYCEDASEIAAENLITLNKLRNVKEVRIPNGSNISGIKTLITAGIDVSVTTTEYNEDFATVSDGKNFNGWMYWSNGKTAYITTQKAVDSVSSVSDVVRCRATDISYNKSPLYIVANPRDDVQIKADKDNSVLFDFHTGAISRI